MRRLLCVCLLLAACGGTGPAGSTKNLYGYWLHVEEGTRTVFAFLPADRVAGELNEPEVAIPPGKDIGVVFIGDDGGSFDDRQITTFDLRGDAIHQTVLGAVDALPGTEYLTKILEFHEGESMTLESKNDPSGKRTYTFSTQCPTENNVGWRFAGARSASDTTAHSPVLAVAVNGNVHSLIGSYADTATDFPRYVIADASCQLHTEKIWPYRRASMVLRNAISGPPAEVHIAYENFAVSQPKDYFLQHRWRAAGATAWQEEDIAGLPTSGYGTYNLFVFDDAGTLVVVASRTNGELEIYRRETSGWQRVTLSGPSDLVRVEDAAMSTTGEIALLGIDRLRRVKSGVVTDVMLPRPHIDQSVNGGVRYDAQGRVHAAWGDAGISNGGYFVGVRSVYGIYDGATWTLHELGPAMYPRPVNTPSGPPRVISGEYKAAEPALVLTTINADETLSSERVSGAYPFGASPDSFASFATALGADGSVATNWYARATFARRAQPLATPPLVDFTINISGQGRVKSLDGRVDCTATCTTKLPLGTRLQIKLEPAAGMSGGDSSCAIADGHEVDGWCWHDVAYETAAMTGPIVHSVLFY